MSAKLTWKAVEEAGEARTTANRPAFLPQMLAFYGRTFYLELYWLGNLPQERLRHGVADDKEGDSSL